MTNHNLKGLGLVIVFVAVVLLIITAFSLLSGSPTAPTVKPSNNAPGAIATPLKPLLFDGASAMRFAQGQCDIGPRPPGTPEDVKTGDFIIASLPKSWKVEEQKFEFRGVPIRNIIAKRGQGPLVLTGAHYDTRPQADNDPTNPYGHI